MNRRTFLASLTATAAGLLIPQQAEKFIIQLDRTMIYPRTVSGTIRCSHINLAAIATLVGTEFDPDEAWIGPDRYFLIARNNQRIPLGLNDIELFLEGRKWTLN